MEINRTEKSKEHSGSDSQWLELDRCNQVTDYLKRVAQFLGETEKDLSAWKWIVIAMHGALYDLAVLACSGPNPRHLTSKKGKLIPFFKALQLCRSESHARFTQAKSNLVLSEEEEGAIKFLKNEFRNPLEHFSVSGWSIDVSGMPKIVGCCLSICQKLAEEVVPEYEITELDRQEILDAVLTIRQRLN